MRERRRNLLVGITAMTALIILCVMVIIFHELPAAIRPGYEVRFTSYDTGGVREGSDVLLAGMRVGRISEVEFTEGDVRKGITLIATIDRDVDIPANVKARITSRGFSGGAAIKLVIDGKEPVPAESLGWLSKEQPATIVVNREGVTGGLLPAELVADIRKAMNNFDRLAETLNTFLGPPPPTATTTSAPAATTRPKGPANLQTTFAKLDAALDAINKNLGDEENQANFKAALANFRVATAAAVEAMKDLKSMVADAKTTMGEVSGATKLASRRFDELISRLIADAGRMGEVLTSLHHITVKIEKGEGTVGRLINDSKLHDNLVETTGQLKATLRTFQELLEKWKEEGVKIR